MIMIICIFSLSRECTTSDHQGSMTTTAPPLWHHCARSQNKSSRVNLKKSSNLNILLSESEIICCVCRRCQHHTVPHSERQETHSHQRHQQQRGLLGRLKGKPCNSSLLAHNTKGDDWWCRQISGPTMTPAISAEPKFKLIINSLS